VTRSIFDPVAAAYDRLRPAYPAEMYDALEQLSEMSLQGARVVEGGAGTGIATEGLAARGARVLAVDVSLAMVRHHRVPASAVVGRAERLPARDGSVDLLCYATSWHWVPFDQGVAEAVRVLRPGGSLALWWNKSADRDQSWWRSCWASVRRRGVAPGAPYARDYEVHDLDDDLRRTGAFASVTRHHTCWERELRVVDRLDELATHSPVLALGEQQEDFLAEQRATLTAAFPDGIVRERYLTHLHVARTPG